MSENAKDILISTLATSTLLAVYWTYIPFTVLSSLSWSLTLPFVLSMSAVLLFMFIDAIDTGLKQAHGTSPLHTCYPLNVTTNLTLVCWAANMPAVVIPVIALLGVAWSLGHISGVFGRLAEEVVQRAGEDRTMTIIAECAPSFVHAALIRSRSSNTDTRSPSEDDEYDREPHAAPNNVL